MSYNFVECRTLIEYKDAIRGHEEFIIAEREDYIVINYITQHPDSFADPNESGITEEEKRNRILRRDCRGIIFDKEGRVIRKPYHKFFNLNERPETEVNNIDWSKNFVILDKLDGSMITPIPFYDYQFKIKFVRYATKMGITEVAMNAEKFIAESKIDYDIFCKHVLNYGFTPIFEWCSRKNRIVVDYPEDQLVLTALRNTKTGSYEAYHSLKMLGEDYGIPVVKAYEGSWSGIQMFMDTVKDLEGAEGYIFAFDDGHRYKAKGAWYCAIHKAKDKINLEKNVIDALSNERIDDIKPFLLLDDRVKLESFEKVFWEGLFNKAFMLGMDFIDYRESLNGKPINRKDFALDFASKYEGLEKSIMFRILEGNKTNDEILNIIKKNCGSQTSINKVRHLWGGHEWSYDFE